MAFKINTTIVANNSAVVPQAVIGNFPSTMPLTISITGPASGSYYQVSLSGTTLSIF